MRLNEPIIVPVPNSNNSIQNDAQNPRKRTLTDMADDSEEPLEVRPTKRRKLYELFETFHGRLVKIIKLMQQCTAKWHFI